VQVLCYEDNRLLKVFSDIVKLLYNGDIVGEDTIQHWFKKGSHPKGRNVFIKVRHSIVCVLLAMMMC
jgi:ABC-type dipeptide/oligopeptide/nickel transport system ATPase component